MISSEIAISYGRSASPLGRLSKPGVVKSNPGLLPPQDGVVLTGGFSGDKNLGSEARFSSSVSDFKTMLAPGAERSQTVTNSHCGGASLKARPGVGKYSNPAPVEVNGEMWNILS